VPSAPPVATVPEPPLAILPLVQPARPGRRRRVRLDDAITWFLASWPYEGPRAPSAATVRTYRRQLEWLCRFAAERRKPHIADMDAGLLRAAFQALMEQEEGRAHNFKGGEAAASSLVAAARSLARWLLAQGVPVADLARIKAPRPPERIQPRLLPDEFRRLEGAVLHQLVDSARRAPRISVARDLAVLYLLADTGLRASETVSMTVGDVDLEAGRVAVHGKGRKPRVLSIVDPHHPRGGESIHLLAEWINMRQHIRGTETHNYLWVSLQGRPLSAGELRKILSRLCADAGLDSNRPPHAFRRAQFTERYRADPSAIKVLAARMGWAATSHHMVNVYTRGAELELAAEHALPSMASLWHAGTSVPHFSQPIAPLIQRQTTAGAAATNERTPNRRRPTPSKGGRHP
jgi:site-specific recombinase XerC